MGCGIYLIISSNNIITGNNFSVNYDGIKLDESSNNIILNNSFFYSGLYVWYSYKNIVSNNTVNGKPLVYLEDESDITIDKAGQIILINSDNITIRNQEISHTNPGIELWDTHNCHIFNNNISDNLWGISLLYSSRNTIQKNNFFDNLVHASFRSLRRNKWKQNYWNRPRILPKLIFGLNDFRPEIWINIDWRPAQEPYDIEVVI
jgi:parallel beta-helix repeat protein